MDNCGKERSHRAVDYNLNSQVPYCLLCAVLLTELSAILYRLMKDFTPMDEVHNFVRQYKDYKVKRPYISDCFKIGVHVMDCAEHVRYVMACILVLRLASVAVSNYNSN